MEEVLRGRKSDLAILTGGGWADKSAANTEVENDGSVAVVTIRQWQLVESLEPTRKHSVGSRCHGVGRRMLS